MDTRGIVQSSQDASTLGIWRPGLAAGQQKEVLFTPFGAHGVVAAIQEFQAAAWELATVSMCVL